MTAYLRPERLQDALALRAEGKAIALAGGTDLYAGKPPKTGVLDLGRIPGLNGIDRVEGALRIGALTTWTQIAEADLPPALIGLQQAARQVGGRQVQNAGTIAGNLCNASPAADGVPPLLVLGAEVELTSQRGQRRLALSQFLLGPRRTALAADELVTAIWIAKPDLGRSAFHKLGARAHLVISIVSVAGRWALNEGRFTDLALAVGSCGPVARRLSGLEAALIGLTPAEAAKQMAPADLAEISPIDDIRATAEYRRHAATVMIRRLVGGARA